MIRLFWRVYWPLVALVSIGYIAEPWVEARVWPIRANQVIRDVARTPGHLCWIWESDKLRGAVSDNVDVFLDTADGDRSFPEIYDPRTGQSWHKLGALPVGHHVQPLCVLLPPRIGPDDRVVVRQTIHYRGLLGLWSLAITVPDVVNGAPLGP